MDEQWGTATPPFTVPVALFWRNSWRLSHSWSAAVQRCQRKIRVWLLGRFGSRHPWLILPRSKKYLQFFYIRIIGLVNPENPDIYIYIYGYGSIPINTIFRGMNIHLPAILMFTRGTRFWHIAIYIYYTKKPWWTTWGFTHFGTIGWRYGICASQLVWLRAANRIQPIKLGIYIYICMIYVWYMYDI